MTAAVREPSISPALPASARCAGPGGSGARSNAGNDPRLAAVRRYRTLGGPTAACPAAVPDANPDGDPDRIVRLAAGVLEMPAAAVLLVDDDRIWVHSAVGLPDIAWLPMAPGPATAPIFADDDGDGLPDGLGEFRFHAGAALTSRDGHLVGQLAVFDVRPRRLSDRQRSLLDQLAAVYLDEVELRLHARRTVEREREHRAEAERQRAAASNLARTLKTSLLPARLPTVPDLDLAVEFEPTDADIVGGDFYDVFQTADGAWFLVVGDACGKGPRAAAYTASVRHAVRAHTVHERSPATVLAAVNETLLVDVDLSGRTWATLALAVLRPTDDGVRTGWRVDLALAGHPRPFLLPAAGGARSVGVYGSIVGAVHSAEFTTVSLDLAPGDGLALYSDGVPDAVLPSGETFGEDRAARVLAAQAGRAAEPTARAVLQELSERGAQQRDDVCLLVARVPDAVAPRDPG